MNHKPPIKTEECKCTCDWCTKKRHDYCGFDCRPPIIYGKHSDYCTWVIKNDEDHKGCNCDCHKPTSMGVPENKKPSMEEIFNDWIMPYFKRHIKDSTPLPENNKLKNVLKSLPPYGQPAPTAWPESSTPLPENEDFIKLLDIIDQDDHGEPENKIRHKVKKELLNKLMNISTPLNTEEKEEWEKEFDEKFDKPLSDEVVRLYHIPNKRCVYFDNTELKSFIKSLLHKQREELVKKVERMSKLPPYLGEEPDVTHGFEEGLRRVIELIKKHE